VTIGEIQKGHGMKGEVRVRLHGVTIEDLNSIDEFKAVLPDGSVQTLVLLRLRTQGHKLIMAFENVTNRSVADKLVGATLTVPTSQLPERGEDDYFIGDLVGFGVYSEAGDRIGVVNDVWELPASDVLQVMHDDREVLIPLVDKFVRQIDWEERRLKIFVMEGLLD
jgi:16S rRNA processing protein RimM